MQFAIMWANENWTRAWNGGASQILLSQDYKEEHDDSLVDDWAKHFNDSRYGRLDGKLLPFIYNVLGVPCAKSRIEKWRQLLMSRYNIDVLIFGAQTWHFRDPTSFGLDGAIEFPPHKFNMSCDSVKPESLHNRSFQGTVAS
jgi:hypothetical protein